MSGSTEVPDLAGRQSPRAAVQAHTWSKPLLCAPLFASEPCGVLLGGRRRFTGAAGASGEANNRAIETLAGIQPGDVIMSEWNNSVLRPCHYVAADRSNHCIVLCIRCSVLPLLAFTGACTLPADVDDEPCVAWGCVSGSRGTALTVTQGRSSQALTSLHHPRGSLEVGDVFSDISANPLEVDLLGTSSKVHEGIMAAATYVHCNTAPALELAAQRFLGWPLLVTGHSLGGEAPPRLRFHQPLRHGATMLLCTWHVVYVAGAPPEPGSPVPSRRLTCRLQRLSRDGPRRSLHPCPCRAHPHLE